MLKTVGENEFVTFILTETIWVNGIHVAAIKILVLKTYDPEEFIGTHMNSSWTLSVLIKAYVYNKCTFNNWLVTFSFLITYITPTRQVF